MPNIDDNLGGDITSAVRFDVPEPDPYMRSPLTLDAARQGKASFWRYLAGIVSHSLLLAWFGITGDGRDARLLLLWSQQLDMAQMAEALLNPAVLGPIPYYIVLNVSFILFFIGIWLTAIAIHRRPLRSVVTAKPTIHWKRMGLGFVSLVLAGHRGQRH